MYSKTKRQNKRIIHSSYSEYEGTSTFVSLTVNDGTSVDIPIVLFKHSHLDQKLQLRCDRRYTVQNAVLSLLRLQLLLCAQSCALALLKRISVFSYDSNTSTTCGQTKSPQKLADQYVSARIVQYCKNVNIIQFIQNFVCEAVMPQHNYKVRTIRITGKQKQLPYQNLVQDLYSV